MKKHVSDNRFCMKGFALLLLLVAMVACTTGRQALTLHTIGDSTMAEKKPEVYPETGWVEALLPYVSQGVTVRNHAVNGRSAKSFLTEGRWQRVRDSLHKGDVVFIQFGHNDQKIQDTNRYAAPWTDYKAHLERFVAETREKGAIPVLFTSIVRRKFDDRGKLTDTHGEYPQVVREVAAAQKVALIDLQQRTARKVQHAGPEKSKRFYLWTPPDEKFPQGRKDDTHLNREGAQMVARLAAAELRKKGVRVVSRAACPGSQTVWRSRSWNDE